MSDDVVEVGRRIASELAEYSVNPAILADPATAMEPTPLSPVDGIIAAYDSRVRDADLRIATRSRFVSAHYADAVEAGVKALNECIRARTSRTEDGDALMTVVFSPNNPILRINRGRSKSDESEQRGHMHLCQGVIGAWRNPRAHTLTDDSPGRALMMLETINDLIAITKTATRTRRRPKT